MVNNNNTALETINPNSGNSTVYNKKFDLEGFSTERVIYIVITTLFTIYTFVALFLLIRLRNNYIIKQRNFKLTLIGGISTFIYGFSNLITQCMLTYCAVNLYIVNIIGPLSYLIFISRAIRLVILYNFNIYKVTSIKKRGVLKDASYSDTEPNIYLAKIYQKVDKIIACIIIIPTILVTIGAIIIQQASTFCKFNPSNASISIGTNSKNDSNPREFKIMQYFGIGFIVVCIVLLFFLRNIKDSYKYGIKFDCLSTAIVLIIAQVGAQVCGYINGINIDTNNNSFINTLKGISTYLKQGKIFFVTVSIYMIFASIVLPVYQCYKSDNEKNKYYNEPTNSIQYFYKILNTPHLLEELKSIAIKEFSVENVLFWENYQILMNMVYKYQMESKQAETMGNTIDQYNFQEYYQDQLQSNSAALSMEDYSYDPTMKVPEKLMPYYISFYYTFIDISGPASVNISGGVSKQIYNEFCVYPTIGMYDEAKNEIVEMMFTSIFPILLSQNRSQYKKNNK